MLDPHYMTCPLFALLGVYVLLSFLMDAWTPLLVRPHLEKIYPLLVDRVIPVHPGTIIKPLVRCGTPLSTSPYLEMFEPLVVGLSSATFWP